MAARNFILCDDDGEMVLPVTPDSYRVSAGVNVEVVNIHQLGDAIVAGYGTLATITISCLLPANSYKFSKSGSPEPYIKKLTAWEKGKARLRFIVSSTNVNVPVIIQEIAYGERDGTNDIYADIILREYRRLEAVKVAKTSDGTRAEANKTGNVQTITIKYGDTLSALCHQYYGNGTADYYNRLAAYNNIANPHLIYAGNTLKIPQPLP